MRRVITALFFALVIKGAFGQSFSPETLMPEKHKRWDVFEPMDLCYDGTNFFVPSEIKGKYFSTKNLLYY